MHWYLSVIPTQLCTNFTVTFPWYLSNAKNIKWASISAIYVFFLDHHRWKSQQLSCFILWGTIKCHLWPVTGSSLLFGQQEIQFENPIHRVHSLDTPGTNCLRSGFLAVKLEKGIPVCGRVLRKGLWEEWRKKARMEEEARFKYSSARSHREF